MLKNIIKGLFFIIFFSFAAHAEENFTRGDPKIIGGTPASFYDSPSTVALFESIENSQFGVFTCAGTLIASRWVLTAAHCVNNASAYNLFVRVGTNDLSLNGAGKSIYVQRIIPHPNYNASIVNSDLALLELEENTRGIPIMPLYTGYAQGGLPAMVVGWGARNVDNTTGEVSNFPSILQKLFLPIVSQEDCRIIMTDIHGLPITNNMICAGDLQGSRDSCQGDSGGPLVALQNDEIRLVGIVSSGLGCANILTYGVYTRVSKFSKWIKFYTDSSGFDFDLLDDGLLGVDFDLLDDDLLGFDTYLEEKPNKGEQQKKKGAGALFWLLFPFLGLLLLNRLSLARRGL